MNFKYLIPAILLATPSSYAANVAMGAEYAYGINNPRFQGGGGTTGSAIYTDKNRTHASYTTLGSFDTGELTDGFVIAGTPDPTTNLGPTAGDAVVGFGANDTTGTFTITFDLGSLHQVDYVDLGVYQYTNFGNGLPTDMTVAFSTDGVSFNTPTNYTFLSATGNGHHYLRAAATSSSTQFVRLGFDNQRQNGNKITLDEVWIEGTAIPEPSSTTLLGLAGIALILRRRK